VSPFPENPVHGLAIATDGDIRPVVRRIGYHSMRWLAAVGHPGAPERAAAGRAAFGGTSLVGMRLPVPYPVGDETHRACAGTAGAVTHGHRPAGRPTAVEPPGTTITTVPRKVRAPTGRRGRANIDRGAPIGRVSGLFSVRRSMTAPHRSDHDRLPGYRGGAVDDLPAPVLCGLRESCDVHVERDRVGLDHSRVAATGRRLARVPLVASHRQFGVVP
jgi:hypothetical protein